MSLHYVGYVPTTLSGDYLYVFAGDYLGGAYQETETSSKEATITYDSNPLRILLSKYDVYLHDETVQLSSFPKQITFGGTYYKLLCVVYFNTFVSNKASPCTATNNFDSYITLSSYTNFIIPVYNIPYYKVTFKDAKGTILKTEMVRFKGAATPPSMPEVDGYTLEWSGSYTDVEDDIVVTASYLANTYLVRFNGNNNTSGSMSDQTFTYGTYANLNANNYQKKCTITFNFNGSGQTDLTYTTDNASFLGWAVSQGGNKVYDDQASVGNLTTVDGDVYTLYACWSAQPIELPTPIKTPQGMVCDGWYTAPSGGMRVGGCGDNYTLTESVTLYAHWSEIDYTIRFNNNGGYGTMSDITTLYSSSVTLTKNAFTRTGYTFAGWATSATGSKAYDDQATVSKLTSTSGAVFNLYAVWTANTYTVTLVPGTSHSVSPTTLSVKFGSAYGTLPTPTSTVLGEVFSGWFTAQSGGTQVTSSTVVSTAANHSLYARFATGTYTVQFDSNGGAGTMANQSFTFGETKALTKNTYTKTHATLGWAYKFLGWSKSSSATSATYADEASVANLASANGETVVLYAVWQSRVKITIQSNDTSLGTVTNATGYYLPGESLTVTATITDSSHIRFLGWYVGETRQSTSATYTLTIPSVDTTYEAKFRDVRHYILISAFDSACGSVTVTVAGTEVSDTSGQIPCLEGDTIGLVATAAYNYDATGWTVRGTLNENRIHSFTVAETDSTVITCTPQFTEKPKYTLTVSPGGNGGGSATLTLSDAYGHNWTGAGESITATAYVGLSYTAKVELPGDDPNLEFEGWSLDGVNVEATKKTYTLTRTEQADAALVASVHSKARTMNVSFTPGTIPYYGYVEASVGETVFTELTGITVVEGQWVTVKATPSAIRNFSHWEIDGLDDTIDAEVRFQVAASMPDTFNAVAVFESRSRNALSVTKENGSLGEIEVSYTDVLDPETGAAGESKVTLAKDTSGNVTNYIYAGVSYLFEATLNENVSAITGNALTEFAGWYAQVGGEWVKQTASLSCTLADTPTVKAVFAYKTLFEGSFSVGTGGTMTYSDETKPDVAALVDVGPKWLDGRSVTLVATPNTGYAFSFWRITIGGVPQATVTTTEVTFSPSDDFTAEAIFEKKKCPVTLSVDAASEIASDGVSASVDGTEVDATALQVLLYGTVVTYSAQTKDGYSFAGWYSDGVLLSSSATYVADPLTDEIEIVARYSATVTLGISTSASASGVVSATATFDEDGSPVFTKDGAATASCTVVLGEKCGIRATATSGAFGSWHDAADTDFSNPLDYEAEDALTVTDNTSLVARLINEDDYTYVALFNEWKDETEKIDGVVLGILSMTKGTEIEEADFNAGIAKAGYTGAAVSGAYAYYRFLGTKRSALSAVDNSGRTFSEWKIQTLSGGAFSDAVTISSEAETYVSTAFSTILAAYWGTPKPVKIMAKFCDGSRGRGSLILSGDAESREETDDEVSAMILQGKEVTVSANVMNGYMFAGWYSDAAGKTLVSKEQTYSFEVAVQTILYAKFTEDRNAIYKWEGLETLKTLRWKSKTYVANRPFDPSCARVDADGYSVGLKVEMFSSPDTAAGAAAVKSCEVASQRARRLVRGRPEKYCAITVVADSAVNCVVVGTSMEGIAV